MNRTLNVLTILLLSIPAITSAGELERETHQLLVDLQATENQDRRKEIIERLGTIGPEAREAIPWFLKNRPDGLWEVTSFASEVVPFLVDELRATPDTVRKVLLMDELAYI